MVLGDWNCRIGEESIENLARNSIDTNLKKRGKLVIDKIRSLGLSIGNGCLPGDVDENITFTHRNDCGQSVVDYLFFQHS